MGSPVSRFVALPLILLPAEVSWISLGLALSNASRTNPDLEQRKQRCTYIGASGVPVSDVCHIVV